ncbi:50S ribosomal protein L6 [bacterium endosymbiont of Pedicinus badii]|uniref:50S ribosomal protein L6 n=1 Tax=bacterium endosymbiont of Pedicinus badii TaxID=1719126 RepID=UPI0009B9F7B4|nr:50S ribosomal protein L6 [bacterium endosymbiont of Pedicinus badii]OQM34113.1 50S ribosomal protein L6 [bacterium endosymbiont of Pedicinus badii]
MSRIAKLPIEIPTEVVVSLRKKSIFIEGKKGKLEFFIHNCLIIEIKKNKIYIKVGKDTSKNWSIAGTSRAILNNMILGVKNGFVKKLILFGVGYRASVKNSILELFLGFSHSIKYKLPEGILAECKKNSQILIKGIDKQKVGQVAAEIRSYRPPEPYKGKGIRYSDEIIKIKETKKK